MKKLVSAFFILAALAALASGQLRLKTYASGFEQPTEMVQDPTRSDIQYVVQKTGLIRVVQNGTVLGTDFIDLRSSLNPNGEKFLFSLAFAPDYATSGKAYVSYVDQNVQLHIHRYTRSTTNSLQLDPSTGFPIMSIETSLDHWGGTIHFGPDGYLYLGTGDGSLGNDPNNNAQNPNSLHGKFLRIDVTRDDFPGDPARNYGIPPTNPFLSGVPIAAAPEVWAFGMRNPWKWSFDMPALGGNGAMIIGDVGQDQYEEVDYEPAGSGGHDYGWRQREGAHDSGLGGTSAFLPLTDPIYDYHHVAVGTASITGGYVYHGTALPASYRGRYFFSDFISGILVSMQIVNGAATDVVDHTAEIGSSSAGLVSSFDIDSTGEMYLVDFNGTIRKIVIRSVSGTVTLQNYSASRAGRQVTVELRSPGSGTPLETHVVTLDANGAFTFPTSIPDGSYDITVKASHWLRKKLASRTLDTYGVSGLSFSLTNGDVNGDNAVTLGDFAQLRSAFGNSVGDPNFNPEADLNGDGAVTLGDFAILRGNFGQQGDQ